MKPEVGAYMLGIEIPAIEDVPEHYVDAFEEKPDPTEFGLPAQPGQPPPFQEEEEDEEKAIGGNGYSADLEKWERMAATRYEEGHPEKALGFESALIPHAMAEGIRKALGDCEDAGDVRALFADVEMVEALAKKGDAPLMAGKALEQYEAQIEQGLRQIWQEYGRELIEYIREREGVSG